MAECQKCGTAVIVPRPIKIDTKIWMLVCNKCYHTQSLKAFVGSNQ